MVLLTTKLSHASQFSFQECLDSNFESTVSHASWPFGLTQKVLTVKKEQCVLEISHTRFKALHRKWMIDVCREPVHIKYGAGDIEVIKRESACGQSFEGDYCQHVKALTQIVQDDGLIFATGRRELMTDEHGKIYCAYLLLNSYLAQGQVLGIQPSWQTTPTPTDKASPQTSTPESTPANANQEKKLFDF
jgi:hypothetical protein